MSGRASRDRHLDPGAAGSPVHQLPGLGVTRGTVTVIIGPADATTRRGQLLTWATVNLLLRCYDVLDTVTVHCPDVTLAGRLPGVLDGAPPATLHQALSGLATATAHPSGRGPHLHVEPGGPVRAAGAGAVTLVLGTEYAGVLAGDIKPARGGATWLVAAGAWKLTIASPAAIADLRPARLPRPEEDGPVSAAAWLAAALGCAEVFKHVGQLREGHGRQIKAFSVNLWTLTGSDGFAELDTPDGPAQPPALPPHYVIGAGAVGEAYLAVLATSDVAGELLLLDHDVLDDTNLNRHILASWTDLGEPKAALATARLAGQRLQVSPARARWQDYLATPPAERAARPKGLTAAERDYRYGLVISAVDRNDSRIAIATARPELILGGSTNGLAVEAGRYRPGSGWQCLACASRPEPQLNIEQAAKELAGKTPAELAAIAEERGLDLAALTGYLKRPACGTLGEHEVRRFAAYTRPDWSVSFVSAASGALLAARALLQRDGDDHRRAEAGGDTLRLWLANATMARTAHRPNPDCPVCRRG